nr:MAG TPA: hypothetical protein [Caudoviricetes sp.]
MYKHVLLKEPGTDRILIVESSGTLKERRAKNYLKAGWEQVGQIESPMHDFELTAGLTSEFRTKHEKILKNLVQADAALRIAMGQI